VIGNPYPLKQNAGKSFQGSIVVGKGFVLSIDEAEALIAKNRRNRDVLFPYINGDDLNNDPDQRPSRWVINFFDWSEEKARSYPDCFEILEKRVKPERQRWKLDENDNEIIGTYALRKPLPQKWWIYGEKRPALYETISKLDQVMLVPLVSKYPSFDFAPKNYVYMHKLAVLALNDIGTFGVLSSNIHNAWCWKNSSTLGAGTLNYSTTDCFETFPFPTDYIVGELKSISANYHKLRKNLMEYAQIGLTKIYNQLNNSLLVQIGIEEEFIEDKLFEKEYGKNCLWLKKHVQQIKTASYNETVKRVLELRRAQMDLDIAVIQSYGWEDIPLKHGFYEMEYLPENDRIRFTVQRDARKEILKRLLELNHKTHAIELPKAAKIANRIVKSVSKQIIDSPTLFN
jgi:hypothetical protein